MVRFREQSDSGDLYEARLETPRLSGYRPGMSTTCLSGRGLARVYDVAGEVLPRDMSRLLRSLDGKLNGSR